MSSRCPWRSHHWPTMLVAKTPVSSRPTTITQHAQAGDRAQHARCSACAALGQHRLRAGEQPGEHAVEQRRARHGSTQIVMASGSQTSRPAMRYFFTRGSPRHVGGRLPLPALARRRGAGAGAAAARRGAASGVAAGVAGFARRRCRRGLAAVRAGLGASAALAPAGVAFGRLGGLLVAAEIGDVPARALELEARGGDLLGERRLRRTPGRRSAAGRTSSAARPARGRRCAQR